MVIIIIRFYMIQVAARIIDDRLGEALSHGCIRLAPENAKWIYDNILDGTTVVIH